MTVPHRSIRPRTVARLLAPGAVLVLLSGMAISSRIFYSANRYKPGAAVLSDFENREDNPRGYMFAAVGTAMACALLLPAAPLFRRALGGSWSLAGAWIYGAATACGILMAALE